MSRVINLTPEMLESVRKEFDEMMSTGRFANGVISFSRNIGKNDKKTTLFFSEMAYLKMMSLVWTTDKEIGWNGIVYKTENGYYCTDILVYPQLVTQTTVESDDEKIHEWLIGIDDDTFRNMNMHGHSHVNMGVTPSGTDENDQKMILTQKLKDDSFYVFIIVNKKGDKNIRIYDLADNILYENGDVAVKLVEDGTGIIDFISESEAAVREKKYTPAKTKYTYGTKASAPATTYGYDDDEDWYRYGWRGNYAYGGEK